LKTLAVIPARAGSKGIRNKNKRLFAGKPLVIWAIECGLKTCQHVVVTSDDPDILEIARMYKVNTVERPAELAQDDTPMLDVIRHVLALANKPLLPLDVVVLLQPTAPLRRPAQVMAALEILEARPHVDSVVSVVPIPAHMGPDFAVKIEAGLMRFFLGRVVSRRQECRPAYYRDGTVYAIRTNLLNEGKLYGRCAPLVLEPGTTCNIDDESDWKEAEKMWRAQHGG
jgi:CMP-N-acetylneuraminic acid synthetase